MIKKWSQFNESKAEKPGESIPGSAKINLSDEDVNAFTDNPSLQKLISDDKVALLGGEVWYWEDDMETKGILDQYLEIPGTVEEEPMNEEFFGGPLKDLMNPRIDEMVEYLNKYKSDINQPNGFINDGDTRKVENMYNYLIQDLDLDTISSSNRQGKKVRGQGESIPQRVKRSVKNF